MRPLMLAGTGSDVGKSVLATALCRIFLQDGYRPAPFKAQNMALNSYATPDGLEIGRAQAVQAEACRLAPAAEMNPLLLKPNSDHTSQVVVMGKPIGNRSAYDYFRGEQRQSLVEAVHSAYDSLQRQYNPIVLEGAGSICELNLRDTDLVNMSMARYAGAAVVLVADIDRGGVFASCYGSIMLQRPEDRPLIRGIIVNKFRGDIRLFDEGRRMLEQVCQVPVLGVVPMFLDIAIDAEDSVTLERRMQRESTGGAQHRDLRVAVVLLPHVSNFTDFDSLERDPRVQLFYANRPQQLEEADLVVLPGTKSTLSDLLHLRRSGMAAAILDAHRQGKTIVGICGGLQMLGRTVSDPNGIEGNVASLPGLGLLPIDTTMMAEKTTRQVEFQFRGQTCKGYEIHQGKSTASEPFVVHDRCIGTYIHGCLDNQAVVDFLLGSAPHAEPKEDMGTFRNRQYDKLADLVRAHLDMDRLYEILQRDNSTNP